MAAILVFLLTAPLAAGLAAYRAPPRLGCAVTGVCGAACFAVVIVLVPAAARHDVTAGSYLRVDALSVVFLLATGFLYAAVAVYLIGFLRPAGAAPAQTRYA